MLEELSRLHVGRRRCICRDTQRHISTTSVGGMAHPPPHLPCYMIFEELSRTSCNLTWPISLLKSDLITTLKRGPPTSRRPRLPAVGSLESPWVRVDRWAEGWLVGGGVLSRGKQFLLIPRSPEAWVFPHDSLQLSQTFGGASFERNLAKNESSGEEASGEGAVCSGMGQSWLSAPLYRVWLVTNAQVAPPVTSPTPTLLTCQRG